MVSCAELKAEKMSTTKGKVAQGEIQKRLEHSHTHAAAFNTHTHTQRRGPKEGVTRSKNLSHVELWPYLGRKLVPATGWQLVHLSQGNSTVGKH